MEFLTIVFLGAQLWMWLTFLALVIGLLALDLGVMSKPDHEISVRESLRASAIYIALGIAFSGFVWLQMGATASAQYLTAFVVEKTLALDNIFVIALIFGFMGIPRRYQHRVLFWGILGVIVLRGVMIGAGATLVARYDWVLYIFAVFLIITGIKMLFSKEDSEPDLSRNWVLRGFRRLMPVSDKIEGQAFVVRRPDAKGRLRMMATPLLVALAMIEFADVVFAVDSVPAVFTITTEPFVVYTSNIFAILGLRALYFALSAILHRFAYLKYALSVLLVFIGAKIFIADMMGWAKFPPELSLGITVAILGAGIGVSLLRTRTAA
ncbi:TerC family protein [Paenirhodobacter enshiensis]|uniref:TerC family protein n=1 Tax=Paenirhodobacter enshiensis TaxID=1105367 RepID=UPI0035B4A81B